MTVLGLVVFAACGSNDSGGGSAGVDCSKSTARAFKPVKANTLTVVTSLPAPGFWNGDDPDSIDGGFEYGIAKRIGDLAGLTKIEIKNVSFDSLVAGHTRDYDVALSQVTIEPERARIVCFTTDYFNSDQGILVKAGTVVNGENQKLIKWGIQRSTTGETFIEEHLKPEREPIVYQDTPSMFTALMTNQIDAVLFDTAIVLVQASESGGDLEVVGQYQTDENYGAFVESGSRNLGLIDGYIDSMKRDGTLQRLNEEFLVPVFKGDPTSIPYLKP